MLSEIYLKTPGEGIYFKKYASFVPYNVLSGE
jgi:hypothetical protein